MIGNLFRFQPIEKANSRWQATNLENNDLLIADVAVIDI